MNATRALELPSEVKKPFVYTGQTPLLDVNNVTKVFEKLGQDVREKQFMTAVNNATLTLHPGESLGIVGESGSGKSTLGRAI
ncbi:ATP-binding cassette domain-containing protein [Vibrio sp. M60_M31a]